MIFEVASTNKNRFECLWVTYKHITFVLSPWNGFKFRYLYVSPQGNIKQENKQKAVMSYAMPTIDEK